MAEIKKYKGIALSAVPYTVEYLAKLAVQFRAEGYDGVCLVCAELFPWSSPSKISAVLYYSELEIAGFAAFCRKNGMECIPALDMEDLPAILFSLKGYEKLCVMKEDDRLMFVRKLLPDLVEDISALLPDNRIFVFNENGGKKLNGLNEADAKTVVFSGLEKKDNFIIRKSGAFAVETWRAFSRDGEQDGGLLYPVETCSSENSAENEYRKLCTRFAVLSEKIMTADSHSRTGCSHPLSFWKGCRETAERLEDAISDAFQKFAGTIRGYINSCWLESWLCSRDQYYAAKSAELKNICSQHIYFFQKH